MAADMTSADLEQLIRENRHLTAEGELAGYIPELAKQDTSILGMSIADLDGQVISVGDCQHSFTLQSISKVISLMVALVDHGYDYVFSKVGMEPSGEPFNSITKLETVESHKPLNPMINSGAIAVASMIQGQSVEDKFERVSQFLKDMTGAETIEFDHSVYESEKRTGDRNRSLAYFMKSTNVIHTDVEAALDLYFRLCSIKVTCSDLAKIGALFANGGVIPVSNQRLVGGDIIRVVTTIMFTAGMYNESGESAMRTGLPAKSGVSGGILSLVPNRIGIGIIGPSIDQKGNSIAGMNVLEALSSKYNLHLLEPNNYV